MRWALLALVLLTAFGCGSSAREEAEPALPASALPGMEATTESLSADDLAADFGADVSVEGFVSGTERVFQGASQDLEQVVSRTLEFESPEAAAGYVDLLRAHVDDLYGVGTTAKPFEEGGRSGYLVDPAACACHRASPTLTAALAQGPRVTYLEVNGAGATPAALKELLAEAP
jgi:plasmid stabilization system protein ParE